MAVTSIKSKTTDAYIWKSHAVYNTAWVAVTGTTAGAIDNCTLGQQNNAGTFYLYRDFFLFDTSPLVGATITAAKLWLYNVNTPDFDNAWRAQIQATGAPPQANPNDPVVNGDYDKAFYAGDGGQSALVSTWPVPGWIDIDLTPAGLGWLAQDGSLTRLVVRSDLEIAGNAPGAGEKEHATINQGDKVGKEPYLEITYTPAAGGSAGGGLNSPRTRAGRGRF